MSKIIDKFVDEYVFKKISCRVRTRYDEMKQNKKVKNQGDIYEDPALFSSVMNCKIYPNRNKYLLTPPVSQAIVDKLDFKDELALVWGSDQDFDEKIQGEFGITPEHISFGLWDLYTMSLEHEINPNIRFTVRDIFQTERDCVLYELTQAGVDYLTREQSSAIRDNVEKALNAYFPYARSIAYVDSNKEMPVELDSRFNPDHKNFNVLDMNYKNAVYYFYLKHKNEIRRSHTEFFKGKGTTKINSLIEQFFNTTFLDIFDRNTSKDGERVYQLTIELLKLVDDLTFQELYGDTDSWRSLKNGKTKHQLDDELGDTVHNLINSLVNYQLSTENIRSGEEIADELNLL